MQIKSYNCFTTKSLCLFIAIFSTISILYISQSYDSAFAAKKNDGGKDNKDQLVVKTLIHLDNVDNLDTTNFFRIAGFINGQEIKKDIPISSIDKTKKTLNVDLKLDSKTDLVNANHLDEFFVCAYPVGDVKKELNIFAKFDCNEGDLLNGKSTEINLFKPNSLVYAKSQAVYQASLNTMQSSNSNSNSNINSKSDGVVKIKIYAPLADKKNTEKLKLAVALNGQVQSQLIEDVQTELDKSKDDTVSRTFTFDRNTDIGPIQIGDKYHACAASEDLRPPEGSECEKRMIKNLDGVNSLYVR